MHFFLDVIFVKILGVGFFMIFLFKNYIYCIIGIFHVRMILSFVRPITGQYDIGQICTDFKSIFAMLIFFLSLVVSARVSRIESVIIVKIRCYALSHPLSGYS